MNKLIQIIAYICSNYIKQKELTESILIKILYLSDWKQAINNGRQITKVEWIFNHYGPYAEEIISMIEDNNDDIFKIENETDLTLNKIIILNKKIIIDLITPQEKETLNTIIELVSKLNNDALTQIVYSTYPILTSARYSKLHLVDLSKTYNNEILKKAKQSKIIH